jgi:hypothetical protein
MVKAAKNGGAVKKAAEPKQETRVSTEVKGSLVLVQDQAPEHIKTGVTRGNENVNTDDLVIPRLEIVQALSPCRTEGNAEYNPHAKVGDLMNSVNNQLYGREVFVVPIFYTKQWLVWKKKTAGGGFMGAFPDPEKAEDRKNEAVGAGDKADAIEVIDTPTHMCLLVNREKGTVDEIILSLPRTKAKISRQWNSMIRMAGGDRFSRVYRVTTNHEKNAKGEFENYAIAQSGFPAKGLYERAEKLYSEIKAGTKNVVMDVKGYSTDEGEDSDKRDDM